MRFAYIDSQGNEVQIQSVEGLAIRIELGAIGPDTQLYDDAADRWGPAHTHEIFHTLSRAMEEKGFVAPPPPASELGSALEEGGETEEEPEVSGKLEEGPEASGKLEEPHASSEPPTPEKSADAFDLPADLDLTLTEPEPSENEGSGSEEMLDSSFEHSPFRESEPESPAAEEEPAESATFDLGAMGPFDLDEKPEEEQAASGEEPEPEEPSGGEMDPFGSGGALGDGLDLEKPMSEFTPKAPPAWMEREGPAESEVPEGEGLMDLSRPSRDQEETPVATPQSHGGSEGGDDRRGGDRGGDRNRTPRVRPVPRSRPSPPKPLRKPFPVGALVGVVILLGIGAGGWYGWSAYKSREVARRAAEKAAALPSVTIPTIPTGLVKTMRTLGDAALSGTIGEFRIEEAALGIPSEPDNAWLGGAYLSNASRYPDVRRYWVLIDSFVDHVRNTDTEVFHHQYVKQLERAGIRGDTAAMLLARADSGFLATRAARFEAYNEMNDLTKAALDLHEFLVRHEAEITYTPAAGGVSKDPVLEAVPTTEQLGKQMWGMVDQITGALNVLGTLKKVTTERLSSSLFDKIRAAGFK